MAIQHLAGRRAVAQSTDAKPANVPIGYKITELDTGRQYMYDGAQWIFIKRLWDSAQKAKQEPRTSLVQLFGDTFAKTALARGYLLEDLNDDTGGNPLTNNNSVTFPVEDSGRLRGYPVGLFDGINQYLSRATEADLEVGTNSFLSGIWFKTTKEDTNMQLFNYGDNAANEENWWIRFDGASNKIQCLIDDGTNTASVTDSVSKRWTDGRWHVAMMFIDKDKDTMYFLVGDDPANMELIGSVSISSVGDLTHATDGIYIGANNNAGLAAPFNGELSNFFLYDMGAAGSEDYNLSSILATGIRETATKDGANNDLTGSTSARLNNQPRWSTNDGDYVISVIHTDEGYYDLIYLHHKNSNAGITDIDIDGIEVVGGIDQYAASLTYNHKSITRGIHLDAGSHILKLRVDGKNASSSSFVNRFQMIELIKRDGSNEGGCTSFNFFGDEFDIDSDGNKSLATSTTEIFNNKWNRTAANADDGDYDEGTFYFKKGLWKITLSYLTSTDMGQIDLDFGSAEVLDQLDAYSASVVRNQQVTKFVRLEGGKTKVRIAVNGKNASSSDFRFFVMSIRGELVSGNGVGDKVDVFYPDADGEIVQNTTWTLAVVTTRRFNGQLTQNTAPADSDEIVFRRYFSGGVYSFTGLGVGSGDAPKIDLGLDSNPTAIFNQWNQFNTSNVNNTLEITRGYHDIHIKVNTKDAGSSAFKVRIIRLLFELIGRSTQLGDEGFEDSEDGSRVLLGLFEKRKSDSDTITMKLANVNLKKYSTIIIEWNVLMSSGSAEIDVTFNNITTASSYIQDGTTTAGGTDANINVSDAHWILFSRNIHSANVGIYGLVELGNFDILDRANGVYRAVSNTGYTESSLHNTTNGLTELTELDMLPNAGNINVGSCIKVYGIRNDQVKA